MKKTIRFLCLYLIFVLSPAVLPAFAETGNYSVGLFQEAAENADELKKAFEDAAARFTEQTFNGVPNNYAIREGDHYMQTFTDGEDRAAAIYVTPEHKGYLLWGPIYEQYRDVGGDAVLGAPAGDPFEIDGKWYQNFRNGSVTVGGENGKAVFTENQYVGNTGELLTDLPEETVTTDTDMGDKITSALKDAASNVEESGNQIKNAAPGWVAWLIILALIAAIVVIGVLYYKKRNR